MPMLTDGPTSSSPMPPPPGLELPGVLPHGDGFQRLQSADTTNSQPEPEVTPIQSTSTVAPGLPTEAQPEASSSSTTTRTQLTEALRRSPEQLDGIFPRGGSSAAFTFRKDDSVFAFLVNKSEKKFRKKTQKVGKHRELIYEKEEPEVQKQIIEKRIKEWSNWEKYTNGRLITKDELAQMLRDDPSIKVIPTRWVDTDKSEPEEEMLLKSRLVVRGDLEDARFMRTDSPTASQEMISLVFTLAACRMTTLWSGDVSAAFLQGSTLDRTLVLSMPKGGIPGIDKDMFYLVSTTVYGTKDAPRGWFKTLDSSMKSEDFKAIPYEQAAYVLHEPDGSLAGLVVSHVDDLMWTGGSFIEEKMQKIIDKYKFGKVEQNSFRYCGRDVVRTDSEITVTCGSLIDRVRPVHVPPGPEFKKPETPVTEAIRGQLRSIIGSLAWLSRVCRPDLSYAVCRMQSTVHCATMADVKFANSTVAVARKTKEKGISYPLGAFKFEDCMVVAIQDASHAADFDVSGSGKKLGFRSQSGRLLCLADRNFKETWQGKLMLIAWHSTVLKRVCRSTLQAETLSLLQGSEEAEHLRYVLHGLWRPDPHEPGWEINAMDTIEMMWFTDCKSLSEHIAQEGLGVVTDKRLAIDLCGLRQQAWRQLGERYGDPLLTDHMPKSATTTLKWSTTDKMLADPLTKHMRHAGLDSLMLGQDQDLTPTKEKGCEN